MSDQAVLTAIGSLHDKIDKKSEDTHKRIDKLVGSVGEVQVTVGAMTVTMKDIKKDVNGHLEDHKQAIRDVFRGVLTTMLTVGGIVIAAWVIYEAGWR